MTIIMTAKHQITIPKKITDVLHLRKGSMFNIEIHKNRIELIPLEVTEKEFSEEVYNKLDTLSSGEKGKEKRISKNFISNSKKSN